MTPFSLASEAVEASLPHTAAPLRLPLLPARLVFENAVLERFSILADQASPQARLLSGCVEGGGLRFEARWAADPEGWLRFTLRLSGKPEPAWGRLLRLVLLDQAMPTAALRADLGWRELGGTPAEALSERPPEEGGGLLPPFGYPIFGPDFFIGAEHPMACLEAEGNRVTVYHHPLWNGEALESIPLVLGVCRAGESAPAAFARYFETIRRPRPERAIVEINTFWTDRFDSQAGYTTDLASYRAMAESWSREVLAGERGLVSHFLLDAGWHDPASLFRPQASNGGPGDGALAALGRQLEGEGFSFGLWFSLNGPIGIDPAWAAAQGYRTHNQGTGSAYSSNHGKTRYLCLTDPRWEEDLSRRMEELIANTSVTFFKGDWDNDALEDPARQPGEIPSNLHLREEIANAMIRIYGRMHRARPGVALRGAWWLSPWWFAHVENTHLPNSGDSENADLPSLTQRDSALTCRDAVCHRAMVRAQSPVPWDVICPHEFASSRRNPFQDTEESWMNNLLMWCSRGSHYLQLYVAPYGLEEWKAWSLREVLRWFRSDEELLWKGETAMLGGDPMGGEVYGYHHQAGERAFLTIRNPLAHPRPLPPLEAWGLSPEGWEQVYPYCRAFDPAGFLMASHEVIVLVRGGAPGVSRDGGALVNTPLGWRTPWRPARPVPALHELAAPSVSFERLSPQKCALHATLPYGLASAEVVLSVRTPPGRHWRAGVGRYPEDVATFGVPITHVRPHWQGGYAQKRLGAGASPADRCVLRFPIGTGGEAHAFVECDEGIPEILGLWIEARENLVPVRGEVALTRPPAMTRPPKPLLALPGERA